jgi:hypothetical protein
VHLISGKSTSPTTSSFASTISVADGNQSQKPFILSKTGSYRYSHSFLSIDFSTHKNEFFSSVYHFVRDYYRVIITATTNFCCFMLKKRQQSKRNVNINIAAYGWMDADPCLSREGNRRPL